jgi:hypothetical protein
MRQPIQKNTSRRRKSERWKRNKGKIDKEWKEEGEEDADVNKEVKRKEKKGVVNKMMMMTHTKDIEKEIKEDNEGENWRRRRNMKQTKYLRE